MKKTIFLIFLIPIAYAFTGSSENYKTTANIGLGAVTEQSSENYKTEAFMVNQPIGTFDSENYSSSVGPYYLLPLVVPPVCVDPDNDGFGDPGTNLLACTGSTTEADNCPEVYNLDQSDSDGDGIRKPLLYLTEQQVHAR